MTASPGQTRTTLCQSRPDVIQPGFKPGTVGTPLALRCSALDHCATREPEVRETIDTIESRDTVETMETVETIEEPLKIHITWKKARASLREKTRVRASNGTKPH